MTARLEGWERVLLIAPNDTTTEAVRATLPCGHEGIMLAMWFGNLDRRFVGRLGCTVSGCRRVFDDVVLGEEKRSG